MSNRFTEKAEKALNNSVRIAEILGHTYIGTEHILLSLCEDELCCAALILKKNGLTYEKLIAIVKEYSGTGVKSVLSSKDLTPRARSILEHSYNLAIQYGDGIIGTEHILLSILEERDSIAIKLLKRLKVDILTTKEEVLILLKIREKSTQKVKRDIQAPQLKQYGKNLCEMARDGKFDPVVGRDAETDRLIRILCRKNKNNPCLIGEAGVGKTAIVEGLAQRIIDKKVPPNLIDKIVISVDLTSMVAGAKYRGDFEDRIKGIINEVAKNKSIILFIDEIHTIVGAGAAEGAIDASNILKPQLARGDIQLIGATTFDEYHKYIEKDSALERRFQPIKIEEPNETSTYNMLKALKSRYEEHHNVIIDDDALMECVYLSKRYINDRFLPDKAIDVLDEACVMSSSERENITKQNIIARQKSISDDYNKLTPEIQRAYDIEHSITRNEPSVSTTTRVSSETVRKVISEMCNMPLHLIKKKTDYSALSQKLADILVGQDEAISKLLMGIKRRELGLGELDKPRGMFLLLGESGIGKTALAVELANNLSPGSSKLLRYDMSEFSEKQSISKLIGSPPGYVGHEEGGTLTEAVRKNPYSVILFDEIEKADRDVLNILLQIADYGQLTDSSGRHVSFRNAIIVATSNVGADAPSKNGKLGFVENDECSNESIKLDFLKRYFKEEFINRFDEIIFLKRLSEQDLCNIAKNKLEQLKKEVENKNVTIDIDDSISLYLAKKAQQNGLGARPLLREIKSAIETPIIESMLSMDDDETYKIKVNIIDNELKIYKEKPVEI